MRNMINHRPRLITGEVTKEYPEATITPESGRLVMTILSASKSGNGRNGLQEHKSNASVVSRETSLELSSISCTAKVRGKVMEVFVTVPSSSGGPVL